MRLKTIFARFAQLPINTFNDPTAKRKFESFVCTHYIAHKQNKRGKETIGYFINGKKKQKLVFKMA